VADAAVKTHDQNTWTNLRRRKVVQWGLVYVAAGWGFLQGLEYVTESFHWPEEFRQIALLALLIGLPIVLVLAWYHGDRGQQRITTPEFAILTLLLLLGGGVFWYYERASEATRTEAAQPEIEAQRDTSSGIKDARPSIAVLPFDNRSREADDAFFVDGIHDDILTQLSKVSALRVISRTSVERFRKSELSVQEIAQQLGVTSVLEGGVQRAGDSVRINVQLIDAHKDTHLWAETYDRELSAANIFAIQSELAAAIASVLKTTLTPAEQARASSMPTRSLEAWESYQRGKQRMAQRTSTALGEAEGHFRKAIARDPTFALAWSGLADALRLQIAYSSRAQAAGLAEAEQAVAQALELDPNLAEGWASAGGIASDRLEFQRAEQMFRRSIALNPNYATAHHWLSIALTPLGQRQQALAAVEGAISLDPLSAIINQHLGDARSDVGLFDDALAAYHQAIEIEPTMALAYLSIGGLYAYGYGRLDIAAPWLAKAASIDSGNPRVLTALAALYWELGDDTESARWLTRLHSTSQAYSLLPALIYLDRGDLKSARKYAQLAADEFPWGLFLLRNDDLRRGHHAQARARYEKAFPLLFAEPLPRFNDMDALAAVDLALVLQHTGETERAKALLDRSEEYFRTIPRMGSTGFWYSDAAILALRGEKTKALEALREAEKAGCRAWWRYFRDFDPNLASIRNEPEFKAVFADIERDMAQQRARLAARPKDAPLLPP
jgi:TolB-like protein/Tfp pilus assembly protein PilF